MAELPSDEALLETPIDEFLTSRQIFSCLKCTVLSKKLVACQKRNSKFKKEVAALKERVEELQNEQEYVCKFLAFVC